MDLSVVVPTLNGREELARCLDALARVVPGAEVVVVDGPSADGTSGMVQERGDVDVLVQTADRTINAARNAGIDRATGEVVAFVDRTVTVEDGWGRAVAATIEDAPVVTGPTHQELSAGLTTEAEETRTIAGRSVTYFNAGNVAFESALLDEFDGFDERLTVGGARDLAHRVAGAGYDVRWDPTVAVRRRFGADGGVPAVDLGEKYRSLGYRLVKNYGLRPTVARRIAAHAARDAYEGLGDIVHGRDAPTTWLGTGREVLGGAASGIADGLFARFRDRSPRRNPYGRSTRTDRAIAVVEERADR